MTRTGPGAGTLPRRVLRAALPLGLLLLAGCRSPQSALDTAGPGAARIASLWWVLLGIGGFVCLVVFFLVVWALVLRRGPHVQARRGGERTVVICGIVLPALVLLGVFGAGLHLMRQEQTSAAPDAGLPIEVVGHDWWWEVRYPDSGAVTANEVHIPVGRPVTITLRTQDVIHSFWVPSLTSKTDLIPGKVNTTWLRADRAGTFRGQCAEFCGLQHANMSFLVIADPPAVFDTWLAGAAAPAQDPTDALASHGAAAFQTQSCSACHTIRGTAANGTIGPDLTTFGSRRFLGAGAAPNDPGYLAGWIANSQTIKPGNLMPPQPLSPDDLRGLMAYLEGLK